MLRNQVNAGYTYNTNRIPSKYNGLIVLILIDKENGENQVYRVFTTEQKAIAEYKLNEEYFDAYMFRLGNQVVTNQVIEK